MRVRVKKKDSVSRPAKRGALASRTRRFVARASIRFLKALRSRL